MPIYEYQCEGCGQILDALQKVGEAPLKKCPSCGKAKLKRLLSAPMFLLKGSGWYETDFKSDKERRKNLADRPEPDAKAADDKPAAPADSKPGATDAKAGATDGKAEGGSADKKTTDKKESAAAPASSRRTSPKPARAGPRSKGRAKAKARRR
jgi:putative FmdB family regulatory protein